MKLNQYWRLGAACALALLISASPARAVSVPSAAEDGLGHFLGCFSLLLDSVAHAQYCGPSRVPLDLTPLGAGGSGDAAPPPPPPCFPCSGPSSFVDLPPLSPYQVASLVDAPRSIPPKPRRWELLMACCPGGGA
ncbi:hypothetical protein [Devosia insulae]|uniref:hypothetical protein n=1 Tax=Devosia insulae TaxID=408174 RepID=UPI00114C8A69|nr:hypothetical protein [Devosia insulae]